MTDSDYQNSSAEEEGGVTPSSSDAETEREEEEAVRWSAEGSDLVLSNLTLEQAEAFEMAADDPRNVIDLDQIKATIARLEAASSPGPSGASNNAKNTKSEPAVKYDPTMASSPISEGQLLNILLASLNEEKLIISREFAVHYLREADGELRVAFVAIAENLNARTHALEESGRFSFLDEWEFLIEVQSPEAHYHDTIIAHMEIVEERIREIPSKGWNSTIGKWINFTKKLYGKPQMCAEALYEYHVQLNAFRERRAAHYQQILQQGQDLSKDEIVACMKEFDAQDTNKLHDVRGKEMPATCAARLFLLDRYRHRMHNTVTVAEDAQLAAIRPQFMRTGYPDALKANDPFPHLVHFMGKAQYDPNAVQSGQNAPSPISRATVAKKKATEMVASSSAKAVKVVNSISAKASQVVNSLSGDKTSASNRSVAGSISSVKTPSLHDTTSKGPHTFEGVASSSSTKDHNVSASVHSVAGSVSSKKTPGLLEMFKSTETPSTPQVIRNPDQKVPNTPLTVRKISPKIQGDIAQPFEAGGAMPASPLSGGIRKKMEMASQHPLSPNVVEDKKGKGKEVSDDDHPTTSIPPPDSENPDHSICGTNKGDPKKDNEAADMKIDQEIVEQMKVQFGSGNCGDVQVLERAIKWYTLRDTLYKGFLPPPHKKTNCPLECTTEQHEEIIEVMLAIGATYYKLKTVEVMKKRTQIALSRGSGYTVDDLAESGPISNQSTDGGQAKSKAKKKKKGKKTAGNDAPSQDTNAAPAGAHPDYDWTASGFKDAVSEADGVFLDVETVKLHKELMALKVRVSGPDFKFPDNMEEDQVALKDMYPMELDWSATAITVCGGSAALACAFLFAAEVFIKVYLVRKGLAVTQSAMDAEGFRFGVHAMDLNVLAARGDNVDSDAPASVASDAAPVSSDPAPASTKGGKKKKRGGKKH